MAGSTTCTKLYDRVVQLSGGYQPLEKIVDCCSHRTCLFDRLPEWQMASLGLIRFDGQLAFDEHAAFRSSRWMSASCSDGHW